ncbi:Transmembrane protein 115 -like protein [Nakaseomyces glabratus]|nr:Transmembrane protein 115 -like protein [Nakaseomyces glabratus]KTB17537.1 Transmembrane protein 115 -like protein [Nakaseomyces glabratus]KTB20779.1 Transmembrane protein 115 -like protein [Nakaseomyces glabratus]
MKHSNKFFEVDIPESSLSPRSLPKATKIITSLYLLLTLLLFVLRRIYYVRHEDQEFDSVIVPFLELVPDKVVQYPTAIILSNLIDIKWWKIITNLLNLVLGGSFIEKNWGSSKEIVIFILVLGSITNLVVLSATYVLAQVFTSIRLDLPIDGNYTVLVGFPIIYRQLLPETTIINIKYPSFISKNFRFKLLPIFVICFMTMVQLVWFHHFAELISIWLTFFTTWIYLRFYQRLPTLGNSNTTNEIIVGDASDTFQLIYIFPDIIKPALRPIFNFSYYLFCEKLRLIKPFETDEIDKGNQVAENRGAKRIDQAIDDIEAGDRRRELALKMLNQRMEEPNR